MSEATFNAHRTATRTQRPASTAVRPDAPRPIRSYFSSPPSRSLSRCNRDCFLPSAADLTLRKNRTFQTNPFASSTSIPVFRPTPDASVKRGRPGKHGRAKRNHGNDESDRDSYSGGWSATLPYNTHASAARKAWHPALHCSRAVAHSPRKYFLGFVFPSRHDTTTAS